LTHSSGLVDYESLIPDSQTVQVHDEDVVELLRSVDTTLFQPGTAYQYSNSGYAVLAQIVQTVSGKRFADFLRERVFHPAGMRNTVAFEDGISSVTDRAYGHTRTDDGWKIADQSTTSAVLGDGGIYSSLNDLIPWVKALSESRILGSDVQQAAFSAQFPATDSLSYGYGWFIVTKGPAMVYHTGSTRGFRTAIIRIPNHELTVILLTNRNEGDVLTLARSIADHFLEKNR
jgi:CubicO group peptidase (beta-lactamase class C family)